VLIEPFNQSCHQPGGLTGDNLLSQRVEIFSASLECIQGVMQVFLLLITRRLQPVNHPTHLRRHFGQIK
jgi:hypothetical protein